MTLNLLNDSHACKLIVALISIGISWFLIKVIFHLVIIEVRLIVFRWSHSPTHHS